METRCLLRVYLHEQDTLLIIPGQTEPFGHTDRNRLRKFAEPTPVR